MLLKMTQEPDDFEGKWPQWPSEENAVKPTTEDVMAQAQVFASAWSLVGGRFDSGDALHDANEAKKQLEQMIRAMVDAAPAAPAMTDAQMTAAVEREEAEQERAHAAYLRGVADGKHAATVQLGQSQGDPVCPTCGSDCNERDELTKAMREIDRLQKECAALASWQCVHTDGKQGLFHDIGGNSQCAKDAVITTLQADTDRLNWLATAKFENFPQSTQMRVWLRKRPRGPGKTLRENIDHAREWEE